MDSWYAYLIASLVGLLVGIERERAHPGRKAMGVRTFLLLAVLGAIAGGVDATWLAAVITIFSLSLVALSYTSSKQRDHGLTTEFAAAIVFMIGYLSHEQPVLAALFGPLVALVLFSRRSLHQFSVQLTASEMQAAILLFLLSVSVHRLLEDRPLDPWGIFNPKAFGFIVLILAVLEFGSYVLTKMMGAKRSGPLVGFVGGLVSSTAVTLSNARYVRAHPLATGAAVISIVAAQLAALTEALLIVLLMAPELVFPVAFPLGGTAIMSGLVLLIHWRKVSARSTGTLVLKSPLNMMGVLRLAILLAGILALIAIAKENLGAAGAMSLAFVAGLFEMHGLVLATATLFKSAQMDVSLAVQTISVAIAASIVSKVILSFLIGGRAFGLKMTMAFVPILMGLFGAYFLISVVLLGFDGSP